MYCTIQDIFFYPGFCLWLLSSVYVIGKATWYFIDSKTNEYTGKNLAFYDLGKVLRLNKDAMDAIEEDFAFIGELVSLAIFLLIHVILSLLWPIYILIVGVLVTKVYRLNMKEKQSEE